MKWGIRTMAAARMKIIQIFIAIAAAIGAPVFSLPTFPTELNINLFEDGSNINTDLRLTIDYVDGDGNSHSINSVDNAGDGTGNTVSWSVKNGKSNVYSLVSAKGGTAISITVSTYETLKITAVEDGYVSESYTIGKKGTGMETRIPDATIPSSGMEPRPDANNQTPPPVVDSRPPSFTSKVMDILARIIQRIKSSLGFQ